MFVFLSYRGSKLYFDRTIHFLATQLEQGIRNTTAAIQGQYLARLEGLLATNPDIIQALHEQDRTELYELTLPEFHVLQKDIKSLFGFNSVLSHS